MEQNIPQELQQRLSAALQELCFYIHMTTGRQKVRVEAIYVSDARTESGDLSAKIAVAGDQMAQPEAGKQSSGDVLRRILGEYGGN